MTDDQPIFEDQHIRALEARFVAEDREDLRANRARRRAGLPEPKRDIRTFVGFASGIETRAEDQTGL